MTSLNPLPPSINPKRSKRCEKKSCLSNPGSLEAPRAAEKAGGTKSKVGVKVMPITSIKPKIIGLVLLPGGRIQFSLQGTYSARLMEHQGWLSAQERPVRPKRVGGGFSRAPRAEVLLFHHRQTSNVCSRSGRISRHNVQGNIRDQVQHENANLINRNPRVVQQVKLLHRKLKPSAVKLIYPIVCQHEGEKPHQQNSVVDYCAPQKHTARRFDIHDAPPDLCR